MPPVVSVLMTAYNREAFVGDAIASVLAQRFTDFELIVCDNQSTDRTVEIARTFERRDARVRVVVNERNLGQFGNRNRAASHAQGRFLKYHDSDDLMYPHCLETMVGLLEAEPRAGFALSTSRAWPGGPAPMLLTPRQCYQREFLGFGLFMCGPASALFRAGAYREIGGFAEDGVHADYLFWMEACLRHHVLLVPADLFWYRTHAGQEYAAARVARDYAKVPRHVWAMLASDRCPLAPEEREQARRNQAWTVAKQALRDLRARQPALAWYRCRQSGMTLADGLRYVRPPRRSASAGTPQQADGTPLVSPWITGESPGSTSS